ncbi:MAG: CBS domain-containing protein [Solirubrobacteraceae bacterium]
MVTTLSTHVTAPAPLLAGITVREAMQLGLFHCAPDADLRTLAHTMAERSIHCVVVGGVRRTEHGGEHLTYGIASDLDLMRGLCEPGGTLLASDVANTDLIAVMPDDTLETAARLMVEYGTAHLIVASPQTGLPVGIVSTLDIARVAAGVPRGS